MQATMAHFANLLEVKFGTIAKTPGMGAAGGAALSCLAFLSGKLALGSEFILEALNIKAAIADADLVITGEGQLDAQSLNGKAPIAVSKMAQKQGKPVLAVCGKINLDPAAQQAVGISLSGALEEGADESYLKAKTALTLRKPAAKMRFTSYMGL